MLRPFVKSMLVVVLLALPGAAQAKLVERYGAWSLYVHEEGKERTCFVTAIPAKQAGTFKRRDQPRLFITRFPVPAPNEQVMIDPGYNYKKGSPVELAVDDRKFQLFTKDNRAWARSPDDDATLIAALRKGGQLTVRGTSQLSTVSIDSYSLGGFTQAHQAMAEACGNAAKR